MAVLGQPSEREAAQPASRPHGSTSATLVVLSVFATFFLVAAVRAPVPGVGEPHYLAKARHFWQPAWCSRDLFLESSNPHLAFYVALGWLTKWGSFETTAWIGRALAQLLLAVGWTALVRRLAVGTWSPLWTAWGFLGLFSLGTLAGEWVVGGVEGKVFSYGFLLLALAAAIDRRPITAAALAGASVSFHSIVGVWGTAALLLTVLASRWRTPFAAFPHEARPGTSGDVTTPPPPVGAVQWAVACLVFVLCSLPGILPSLQVVMDKSAADSFAANYIQVFYRLSHHLYPATFAPSAALGYLAMLAAWRWLSRKGNTAAHAHPHDRQSSRRNGHVTAYVIAVCLVALGGAVIGLGEPPDSRTHWQAIRMTLMKFYPFRLFDVVVPFVLVTALADRTARWTQRTSSAALRVVPWLAWCVPLLLALTHLPADRNPSRLSPAELADWKEMCAWADTHLPEDALVCTPYGAWAFKWYAGRAEYVSYKDCPQDAAGIIEWNRRLKYLDEWGSRAFDGGYTAAELRQLRDDTNCSHWLAYRAAPVHVTPLYEQGRFRLYDLHALDPLPNEQRPSSR